MWIPKRLGSPTSMTCWLQFTVVFLAALMACSFSQQTFHASGNLDFLGSPPVGIPSNFPGLYLKSRLKSPWTHNYFILHSWTNIITWMMPTWRVAQHIWTMAIGISESWNQGNESKESNFLSGSFDIGGPRTFFSQIKIYNFVLLSQ